ncbi:MAG: CoA pyrophosphatase [Oligoflexia bacterium]|nr:CoA pyrophosphatase [Oligoflexia bacterium]
MSTFEERLIQALQLDVPYAERPPTPQGTRAAVLMLFAEHDGRQAILVTRRTDKVETHKGQMAFPGGHCEADELKTPEGFVTAALRETEEEVGIPRERVKVLGRLPGLWTPTGFWVVPIVGVLTVPLHEVTLHNSEHEIAEALWVPFAVLTDPEIYQREIRRIGAVSYPIHVYQVGVYRIWGATGAMIKNLLDRLAKLG